MKQTLKITLTLTLLTSTLILTDIQADDTNTLSSQETMELSIEQQEKQELKELERAEQREQRIEKKKELIRTRMEARDIPSDEIDAHIERLFGSL